VNVTHIFLRDMTGTNVIMQYSNTILSKIFSGGSLTPRTGTIIIGVIYLFGLFSGIFTASWFKRMPLFVGGYFGIFICNMALGILIIMEYNMAILIFLCIFIILYGMTTGTLIWLYTVETCTDVTVGVCMSEMWATVILLLLITQPLMNSALQP